MDGKEIAGLVLKYVDVKGLVVEAVIKGIVKTKLQELAASSENKFDDAAFALVYPLLEEAVIKFLDAQLEKVK